MRFHFLTVIAGSLCCLSSSGYAELQNVEVGGKLTIRGRYMHNIHSDRGSNTERIPRAALQGRPIGWSLSNSRFKFDNRGADWKLAESRVQLNAGADFTDYVSAFIEFDDYHAWGEDFRSDYITGADARAVTSNDVEVFQAYINVDQLFGQPLTMRIGRQELRMGKGWLVDRQWSPMFGRSFDGIRLEYQPLDDLSVDAWWAKLAENGNVEEDGDIDFYGLYATYSGIEHLSLSGYYMLVRDAQAQARTAYPPLLEWLEDVWDLDDYGTTRLNTVGVRLFGGYAGFDYDLELAYQFGPADAVGAGFTLLDVDLYGDNGARFDAWGAHLDAGYRFDISWSPRVFLGGAYYEGADNRDISFRDWLNPFQRPEASVSFNRLFSSTFVDCTLDRMQLLSNLMQVRTGVTIHPLEKVRFLAEVEKLWVDEPFDVPVAPALPFWTREGDDDIGVLTTFLCWYQYSEDLSITFRWEHLFSGDAVSDGAFVDRMGTGFLRGTDQDDTDFVVLLSTLSF